MPALKTVLQKLVPVISTALFYALYYLISSLQFDMHIKPAAVPFDYLLQLLVAYILFALSRRLWVFVVLQGLMMGVLYVGNAMKISFFGGPIMPDDVYALRSLLLVLDGWRFIAAALPLAAIAALLLFNFTLRHWSAYLASMLVILFGITLVYKPVAILEPLDRYFGNSVWDQRSNYLYRGATLYSLQEGARYFADAHIPPDRDLALSAAANLLDNVTINTTAPDSFTPRNVHIVLLESFWDPALLKEAGYNQDPLAPAFRRLWERTGFSHVMSPVFGGYTANAEFEILCGFPVVEDNVKFERQLLNDVPCLPHLLAEHGYRTLASHPNVSVFWNRINAYRRMGFQTYWSKQDFLLDDMNREFLSDASLYRQVLEKIADPIDNKQPLLNYIVTYFGHWNYPLNDSRPNRITASSDVDEVSSFANTMHYKSLELMTFLEQLQTRDPDSIEYYSPPLADLSAEFDGSMYRYVQVRLRKMAETLTNWEGFMYWTTAGHSWSDLYRSDVPRSAVHEAGEWVTLTWDMHNPTFGGDDWKNNTIKQIRFDLSNDIGPVFEIDWVAIGRPAGEAVVQLQEGTRIINRYGEQLGADDIAAGMPMMVDGVLDSAAEPDVVSAALIVVDTDAAWLTRISGTVGDNPDLSCGLTLMSDSGDRSIRYNANTRAYVVSASGSEEVSATDIQSGLVADVFGAEATDGCFSAETIIAFE